MSRYQNLFKISGYNSNNIIENYAANLASILKDDYESLNGIRFTTYEIINNKVTYNFNKNLYKIYKFNNNLEMEVVEDFMSKELKHHESMKNKIKKLLEMKAND